MSKVGSPPVISIFASQKSAGKTFLATFVADVLVANSAAFQAFQVDDQKRLGHLIGDVVDLRPDPDLIIEDPTIVTRALTPFHEAGRAAATSRTSLLLDCGANQVELLGNFLSDVGFDEDARGWDLPIIIFVPFLPLDAESTTQAAFTVERMRAATPSASIVIVENRYGGSVERIVKGSHAAQSYQQLVETAKDSPRIVMPAIAREYWAPWEGAGIRFLKALAMDAEDASAQLGRSVGEIKIARSAIARFWRAMHRQINEIVELPEGGA